MWLYIYMSIAIQIAIDKEEVGMIAEKVSVLLVEDNKLVRKMSIIVLEQLNCMVDAVSTGRSGIEYANNRHYDLIFMDIGLPDMCGLDVIDQIRKYSKVP